MEALARDSARQQDLSLWARQATLAVQKAAEDAAIRHKQAGVPMVVSESGNIKLIQPEDIIINYDILNAPYPEV